MKNRKDPLTSIAVWSAAAIVSALIAYGALLYFQAPGSSPGEIVVDRLAPIAAMGIAVAFVSWAVVRRIVLLPLQEVAMQVYGIGAGRLKPISIRTDVPEIQALAGEVNVIVRRLQQDMDAGTAENFQRSIDSLRHVAKAIAPRSPERTAEILDDVTALERDFYSVRRREPIESALLGR